MVHITGLPADSAFVRKQLKAPLGWDNTTEMVAGVLDAVNYMARVLYNANVKEPDTSDLIRTPRPYEDEIKPGSVSLDEFARLMKGDNA